MYSLRFMGLSRDLFSILLPTASRINVIFYRCLDLNCRRLELKQPLCTATYDTTLAKFKLYYLECRNARCEDSHVSNGYYEFLR